MPWLLWNFDKQDAPGAELVVVDSSARPLPGNHSRAVRVFRCEPGTSVARKRNLALHAARGAVITWFDDDDWQHPRKLSLLIAAMAGGQALAGSRASWFVDLRRGRARPYQGQRRILFNTMGAVGSAVRPVPFDERLPRAADTAWLTALRTAGLPEPVVLPEVLSFWLCHQRNVSNPASRYVFRLPLTDVARAIGTADWADTGQQLAALRERLSPPPQPPAR